MTSKPFYLTLTTDAIKKHGSLSSISYFLLHSGVYTSGMRCMNNFGKTKAMVVQIDGLFAIRTYLVSPIPSFVFSNLFLGLLHGW